MAATNTRHDQRRRAILAGDRGHQLIPVLAMVMKNSRTTNAPSSSAMIRDRSRWRLRMISSSWLTTASHRSATSTVNKANR